jgi:hypothetical protein
MTNLPEDHDQNTRLLALALHDLQVKGSIEYSGEYGPELATFIPFIAWLKANGHLAARKVVTYSGMRSYYFFLTDDEYAEKSEARRWVDQRQRRWPGNDTRSSRAEQWHVYPDYRAHFSSEGPSFTRPVLFIQNKFAVEWGIGPINYLPLKFLDWLLAAAQDFHVIYSRPGISSGPRSYSRDHNRFCDYPDRDVVMNYPRVEVLEDECVRRNLDYNGYKLQILAKCHHFISAQGGGAHLLSCFGNSILVILHNRGHEYPHAYKTGPYKYLSTPPPILMVASRFQDLIDASKILLSARMVDQRIAIDRSFLPDLERLKL